MTHIRFLQTVAMLVLALGQPGCGQEPKNPPPSEVNLEARAAAEHAKMIAAKWNVRVDVQIVSVPESRAVELLPGLRSDDAKQVDAAVAQLQQLLRDKEATLVGWPEVICLDGTRAISESIDEERYPVEFSPPTVVNSEEPPAPQTSSSQTPAVDEEVSSPAPAAFETRNVGVTLEVEADVLDEGRRLLVTVVPQHVRLLGYQPFDAGRDARGQPLLVEQPQFSTTKTTTTVNVRNGQHLLLNVHKLDSDKENVELVILHAVASKIE